MSEAMKPTPGPWTFYTEPQPNGCPIVGNGQGLMVAMVAHSVNHSSQKDVALSDARLIAEAGTVFHETGLSPRQILEQRDELLAIATNGHADVLGLPCGDLLAAANILRNHGADELARRLEDKHELECAAITKYEAKP